MTCTCTAQFCYICGERWKGCDCPWFNYDENQPEDAAPDPNALPPPPADAGLTPDELLARRLARELNLAEEEEGYDPLGAFAALTNGFRRLMVPTTAPPPPPSDTDTASSGEDEEVEVEVIDRASPQPVDPPAPPAPQRRQQAPAAPAPTVVDPAPTATSPQQSQRRGTRNASSVANSRVTGGILLWAAGRRRR